MLWWRLPDTFHWKKKRTSILKNQNVMKKINIETTNHNYSQYENRRSTKLKVFNWNKSTESISKFTEKKQDFLIKNVSRKWNMTIQKTTINETRHIGLKTFVIIKKHFAKFMINLKTIKCFMAQNFIYKKKIICKKKKFKKFTNWSA